MKKLELKQMENLNGGTGDRGCLLAGAAVVVACCIPGGGVLAGLGIFGGAALSDCF